MLLKQISILFLGLLLFFNVSCTDVEVEYDFGDYSSEALIAKAWDSFAEKDFDAVLAFTNECISLYAQEALSMQESLASMPKGGKEEVQQWWALNDVATALYLQGESYRKMGKNRQAKERYQRLIDEYPFGQCWDEKGWYWSPAKDAKKKLKKL